MSKIKIFIPILAFFCMLFSIQCYANNTDKDQFSKTNKHEKCADLVNSQECTIEDEQAALAQFNTISPEILPTLRNNFQVFADSVEQYGASDLPEAYEMPPSLYNWAIANPRIAVCIINQIIEENTLKQEWVSVSKKKSRERSKENSFKENQQNGQIFFRDIKADQMNFNILVREVVNQNRQPYGFDHNSFGDSVFAIMRENQDNIIYLMDANYTPLKSHGNNQRFGFGINHILSPGPTQSQRDANICRNSSSGHRSDFGIKNDLAGKKKLAKILMTALSSRAYKIENSRNGVSGLRQLRFYQEITIQNGNYIETFTNILIVIDSNGNIITAYKKSRNKCDTLESTI